MKTVWIGKKVNLWKTQHVSDEMWDYVFYALWAEVDEVLLMQVRNRIMEEI